VVATAARATRPPPSAEAPIEFRALSNLRQVRRLPAEERAPARAAIEAGLPEVREATREALEAMRELGEAMRAEPFDAQAAHQAAARAAAARGRQSEATMAVIIDVFETLPPERRAQFLEARGPADGPPPGALRDRLRERMEERGAAPGEPPQP